MLIFTIKYVLIQNVGTIFPSQPNVFLYRKLHGKKNLCKTLESVCATKEKNENMVDNLIWSLIFFCHTHTSQRKIKISKI